MREMIVAEDEAERPEAALAKLLPMQRGDFEAIFRAMEGFPVTIRLLDPPLHEFLPQGDAEIDGLAAAARTCRPIACAPSCTTCARPTRCWASAAAGSASSIPRSPRCRPAPSSRPPARSRSRKGRVHAGGHDPARRHAWWSSGSRRSSCARWPRRCSARCRSDGALPARHDDRAAARRADRRRDRARGAVLLLRHQRPHPDHLGTLARRRRAVPARLHRARHHRRRSVPGARPVPASAS